LFNLRVHFFNSVSRTWYWYYGKTQNMVEGLMDVASRLTVMQSLKMRTALLLLLQVVAVALNPCLGCCCYVVAAAIVAAPDQSCEWWTIEDAAAA
jgi:hypothetical protein